MSLISLWTLDRSETSCLTIADKELSELLARDQLIPVVHETTYDALREVSPLLGSRSGLSTAEDSMADIAAKIAELVDV